MAAALSGLTLMSVAVLVASPASAAPPQPTCGSTLTVDTALQADLWCEDSSGLTLAPGVDLNLRGHTLGSSSGAFGFGVAVPAVGDTTIRNGTLAGWGAGVTNYGVRGDRGVLVIQKVAFVNNELGVDASSEDTGFNNKPTTITRSSFTGSGRSGIRAVYADLTVDHTTFTENQTAVFSGAGTLQVTASQFARNDTGLSLTENHTTVDRSTFTSNPHAVVTNRENWLAVTASRFTGSDVAVDVNGAGYGTIDISGSTFLANTTAVILPHFGGSLVNNTFRANHTTVTLSETPESAVLIQGNTFRLNADGLLLENANALVSIGGNEARRNTGWGISAPGATDLGGDTAAGNGNDPQCVGVVCGAPRQS
ncbi:right-handed parallel beta-helix repeat-containing protein [Cellulomonas sp. URHE0023]|uniref:right-handed parallel beta-helix repeat-containing protein n=1 Tax=Cellulomonas sp. URHE0023 TaxID=1380354 RepID=UPI000487BB3D|nr:right-handed parallel beta-helix repeat-containing protein [Cellulomonas sp. URHE0023]